jgi:GxxExxY protein
MNTDEASEGADARDPLTGRILGAAFEVSNILGNGFLEAVYQRALAYELALAGLVVEREVGFRIAYKGEAIGTYIADLVVERSVIVELKAIDALGQNHVGQCLNYLRASGLRTALLLNFGRPKLEFKRVRL